MAVLAHSGAAVPGLEVLLIAIVDERVEPIDRLDHDIAALAAIAAVGTAELDEFLAPERHAAVAAVARANIDLGLVEKLHNDCNMRSPIGKWQSPARDDSRARLRENSRQEHGEKGGSRREGPGWAMPH